MDRIFNMVESEHQRSFTGRDLLSLLFKHKYIISATFLIVAVFVSWGIFSLPAVYTSSGKILIETEQQGKPSFFSGVAAYEEQQQSDPVNRKMETEMQLVETRPIAEEVVRSLDLQYWDLYHKPLVHFMAPIGAFYDDFMQDNFDIAPDPEKYGFDETVTEFIKSFAVGPAKSKSSETTSNIVQITMQATDPVLVQQMLQKLMEVFANHDIKNNEESGQRAYEIVHEQTSKAYSDLSKAQTNLKLLLSNGEVKKVTESAISTPGDIETIALIKEQLLSKQLELLEVTETYEADSERYKKLQSAIDGLIDRLKMEESMYAESDASLAILEREVSAAETVYLELKKRLAQIGLYIDMNEKQLGNRLIVEPAFEPRESSFKKDVFLAVFGSIAGLVLGCGIAGFREYMDHTISNKEEVERRFGIEVLGSINMISGSKAGERLNPVNRQASA